ncbi:RICIN domain-containing protein [Flammeovirga aprica]|uniref:Ricin-type beta-trefoil lectin domain protein n=1 Tax=Flammeovirga aprica JL-4 TaxID=694437 RepID=A0A7X9RZQ4_9BACT|nr:RICIN domain-containing protein [Flammeovirga aprica]NME71730.1 ricin-type beta-trefoil lectin domain protein [Flammeovirga aprica JL-4]
MKRTFVLFVCSTLLMLYSFNVKAQKVLVKPTIQFEGETYYIRSVETTKTFDLPGTDKEHSSKKNGAKLGLYNHENMIDRKYKFKKSRYKDWYFILVNSDKFRLDVHGCYKDKYFCKTYKHKKGAQLQIWSYDGSNDNDGVGLFRFIEVRKGQYRILNKYSGLSLDATGDNKVIIWDWHGGQNQLWEFIHVKTGQRYEGKLSSL